MLEPGENVQLTKAEDAIPNEAQAPLDCFILTDFIRQSVSPGVGIHT